MVLSIDSMVILTTVDVTISTDEAAIPMPLLCGSTVYVSRRSFLCGVDVLVVSVRTDTLIKPIAPVAGLVSICEISVLANATAEAALTDGRSGENVESIAVRSSK